MAARASQVHQATWSLEVTVPYL